MTSKHNDSLGTGSKPTDSNTTAPTYPTVHAYFPAVSCTLATIDQFNRETDRMRQAIAQGIPFTMFTSHAGWMRKNGAYLPVAFQGVCRG